MHTGKYFDYGRSQQVDIIVQLYVCSLQQFRTVFQRSKSPRNLKARLIIPHLKMKMATFL